MNLKKSKIAVLLALTCMCIPGCAGNNYTKDSFPGYILVGGNSSGESLYMDRANIDKTGEYRTAWFITTTGSGDYLTYYLQFDCHMNKYKRLHLWHYADNGKAKSYKGEEDWAYPIFGTWYEIMFNQACK